MLNESGLHLFWNTLLRELDREGRFFTKPIDKDIRNSFSVVLPNIFAESKYNPMGHMHKFATVFIPNHIKIYIQACLAKQMENIW